MAKRSAPPSPPTQGPALVQSPLTEAELNDQTHVAILHAAIPIHQHFLALLQAPRPAPRPAPPASPLLPPDFEYTPTVLCMQAIQAVMPGVQAQYPDRKITLRLDILLVGVRYCTGFGDPSRPTRLVPAYTLPPR